MKKLILILTVLLLAQMRLWAQTPTVTNQPASLAVWSGANATFTVGVAGGGPLTYQWLHNSTDLPLNIITTVAGGGIGDGGAATNANLASPSGMAIDAAGNIFIADEGNNRIRKVSTNGVITTVAGTGLNVSVVSAIRQNGGVMPNVGSPASNFSGDGGPATNATLYRPSDVVLDSAGNLLIADSGNNRVRKVDTNGIITTVAGNGTAAYAGDGGAATNASLSWPAGLALDAAGNLFVADAYNYVIRKVGFNGSISTVAGTNRYGFAGDGGPATNALLGSPEGVAVDGHGNVFISDAGNQRIRKVDAAGVITTYAGTNTYGFFGDGGPATNAALWNPGGLALNDAGGLFVADSSNNRVRKIGTNGIITSVAGTNTAGFFGDGGAATNAAIYNPLGVRFDSKGNLFIADSYNNRVRKVGTNNLIATIAGNGSTSFSGDGGPATAAAISDVNCLALDSVGNLYLADAGNARIRRVGTNGLISTFAGNGVGGYSGDNGAATNASLYDPVGVAVNVAGEVFVADALNNRIRKIALNGKITTVAGTNGSGFGGDGGAATNAFLSGPSGVAVDAAGNLYIADASNQRIRKVDTNGIITTCAGNGAKGPYLIGTYSGDGGPATNAGFSNPAAVAADAAGNVFIADAFNYRIRKVGTNGIVNTVAGNGLRAFAGDGGAATNASIGLVYGLSVDGSGNLFIADTSNSRTRKVHAGIITTIAGSGSTTFAGDGGAATNASLNQPSSILPDQAGNWLIADTSHERVRKVTNLTPGPVLALTNVSGADAGGYQLLITDSSGSVTSSVAFLTVATSPLVYRATHGQNGSLALDFVCAPASTNVVLAATNLGPGAVWIPLATNVAAADGDWQFTDTNTARWTRKFYRSATISSP
jgi:sugar lactone lactonase YvrE